MYRRKNEKNSVKNRRWCDFVYLKKFDNYLKMRQNDKKNLLKMIKKLYY